MNMQALVFVLLASVLFAAVNIQTVESAGYDHCYNFAEYKTLMNLLHHDNCMNIDSVFELLADLTRKEGNGYCRVHAISELAGKFGSHAGTPHHCHCDGVNRLQQYHTGHGDGMVDHWSHCLGVDPYYRHLYDQFFVNSHTNHPPACRTHHSLWNTLNNTQQNDLGYANSCQKDIVFHINYAFSHHRDSCTCSEASTQQTNGQHGNQNDNCHHLDSFNKLMQLEASDGCLSANSVWHYLDDLQVYNPECRVRVQRHLAQKYHNAQSQDADDCECRARTPLVDHEIHRMSNASYPQCRYQANGGTYNDITYDLFDNIRHTGCLNHNYLWEKLQGIHNYYQVDCTQDLIVRAAIQYSTDDSDPCVCSKVTTTSSSTSTTTTTTTTTTAQPTPPPNSMSTVHQTNGHQSPHTESCHHLDSFNKLMRLGETDGCLSANSVWHYLDDLQVKSPECRARVQKHLADITRVTSPDFGERSYLCPVVRSIMNDRLPFGYSERYPDTQSQTADACQCRERRPLVNHEIHRISNGSYDNCRYHAHGGTYTDITNDLFDNIQTSGCLNHNYLWNKVQGIHNYHHHHHEIDCTQDLIVRAAIQYPTDESDSCVCSRVTNVTTTASHITTQKAIITVDTTLQTSTTDTLPPASATSLKVTYTTTTKAAPTQPAMQKFSCDKLTTIENMVNLVHVAHPNSSPCDPSGQGSDDAYILSVCNMTSPSTWRKGINVMADCEAATPVIPTYTPISTFTGDNYNPLGAKSGVFLGCFNNGIKIAVQKCNGLPEIIHVESGAFVNNPRNYYVIV